MPTYLDAINRVQDDFLNRTTYNSQVRRAINTTIRLRQRERFWFNETLTALTANVSIETLAKPADFLWLDRLEVTENSASTKLILKDLNFIRHLNLNNASGLPTVFCEYADKFHLANIPDSAYAIPCYYVMQYPPLSADTDTNHWLSAAEDVIVYGAAKLVWATTIRNASAAAVCAQLETDAIRELRRMRDQEFTTQLRNTRF